MNSSDQVAPPQLRRLGLADYAATLEQMRAFTDARDAETTDELWLLQHPAIFTQGLSGRAEHVLDAGNIPVVQVDRGGQVTYHGPGQWVVYLLLDLRRRGLGVRALVSLIESALIGTLAQFDIEACADPKAPGVYVSGEKIASLGLRVRRGSSYHGLALNVDMELEPFLRINPCGHANLAVTSMRRLLGDACPSMDVVAETLIAQLTEGLADD
ncbi:MAG: lipoyl(octanoyl) transferase [Halieaceae bacterium]